MNFKIMIGNKETATKRYMSLNVQRQLYMISKKKN